MMDPSFDARAQLDDVRRFLVSVARDIAESTGGNARLELVAPMSDDDDLEFAPDFDGPDTAPCPPPEETQR